MTYFTRAVPTLAPSGPALRAVQKRSRRFLSHGTLVVNSSGSPPPRGLQNKKGPPNGEPFSFLDKPGGDLLYSGCPCPRPFGVSAYALLKNAPGVFVTWDSIAKRNYIIANCKNEKATPKGVACPIYKPGGDLLYSGNPALTPSGSALARCSKTLPAFLSHGLRLQG